ncbi:Maf family protein [Enterococcus timonensis]|uniref:Maf family protein n=1 Tax=Enterococcus timonensis TaxID=1852364 RepID=UPI0008D95B34|nr:Maf family protein [Enterococcus timonensis]
MILASQSPRRQMLLKKIVENFSVIPADIDESQHAGEIASDYVQRLSAQKAAAIAQEHPTEMIVASDTVVALDGKIFGKPHSRQEAFDMLQQFSGKTHQALTGVCLRQGQKEKVFLATCDVTFFNLSAQEINHYLDFNEYADKAGAYGIQDHGSLLVEKIAGDYYAIVGLPVGQLNKELANF